MVGDPQFSGLRGQSFQVHGTPNSHYALISTPDLHINANFQLLTQGQCTAELKARTACYSHAGNYFGDLTFVMKEGAGVTLDVATELMETVEKMMGAVAVVEDYEEHISRGELKILQVIAGDLNSGLRVVFAEAELIPSMKWRALTTSDESFVFVHYPDSSHLVVVTSEFIVRVDNSDHFLNTNVGMTPALVQRIVAVTEMDEAGEMREEAEKRMPHGLLGQTWSARRHQSRLKVVEGEVDDYHVNEGTDTSFPFTRFE